MDRKPTAAELAEKYAMVENVGLNARGDIMYAAKHIRDLELRPLKMDAFLAGRASCDEEIEALRKALEEITRPAQVETSDVVGHLRRIARNVLALYPRGSG